MFPPRKSFIDREKDYESGFGNFGVRQYDEETGRFVAIDPLWENYRQWNPYQYCRNNPLNLVDPSGFGDDDVPTEQAMATGGFTTLGAVLTLAGGIALMCTPTGVGQVAGGVMIAASIASLGLGVGTMASAGLDMSKGKTETSYVPQSTGEGIGYGVDKASGGNGEFGAAIGGLTETVGLTMLGGINGQTGKFTTQSLLRNTFSMDAWAGTAITGVSSIVPAVSATEGFKQTSNVKSDNKKETASPNGSSDRFGPQLMQQSEM